MLLSNASLMPIEILLQAILNRFLNSSYCLTFVVQEPFNFQISLSFVDIVSNGTDREHLVEKILEVSDMGCSDFVVRMKEPATFIQAFDKATHLGTVRRSDRKLIILPHDEHTNAADLLDIISMKETSYVANFLLILSAPKDASGCAAYDLVTHKFVGENYKHPNILDSWNACTMQFENDANLFPHDMSNMFGKTVKVACFTYQPYSILDLDPAVAPFGRDGTEIRIVDEFCRWINCTIEIVKNDEDQWGEIYDNMTGIGVLGTVVEDRADVGISALYSWYEEFIWLDFSAASIRSAITCIAPAPRLLVSWDMPLLPFSWNMWIGMLLTFLFCSLALAFAQRSSDTAFLTIFGILTSQSQDVVDTNWRIRIVTGWVFFSVLILGNAYGAGLSSTFTVPKFETSVETIHDIVDSKMEWGATHDAWIFSLTLSQEPLVKKLVSQFKVLSFEELKRRSFTRELAFSVEKLPSGCFAIGGYIEKEAVLDLRLMKEDFYYEQNVAMMRKSSPYTQKISDLIGRLHETGLLLGWESQVALKYLDYKVQLEVKLSRSKKEVEIQPISIRQIVGIFYIYVLGIGIAFIVFIVEVSTSTLIRNRRDERFIRRPEDNWKPKINEQHHCNTGVVVSQPYRSASPMLGANNGRCRKTTNFYKG